MIEVQNVTVGHSAPLLQNISFTAKTGQITALVGLNGCGKTTILRAIAGQHPIRQGTILLDGRPLQDYRRRELAQRLSYMPQVRTVPDISVQRLVEHGRYPHLGLSRQLTGRDHRAVETAMELTDTQKWADRELRRLSGGERQRVYLAMALAQGGQNLLLDEPTTFLDAAAQFHLLELLQTLAEKGKAVLLVIHDLAQAMQYCDRIAVLSGGQLAAFDTPEQLYAGGLLEKYFHVQVQRTQEGVYYLQKQQDRDRQSVRITNGLSSV